LNTETVEPEVETLKYPSLHSISHTFLKIPLALSRNVSFQFPYSLFLYLKKRRTLQKTDGFATCTDSGSTSCG